MQEWAVLGVSSLLAMLGFTCVYILNRMSATVDKATESIEKLNTNVAVVIERIEYHDERIKKLEERSEIR